MLINDLVRHPLHMSLVYAGLPLYRSRLTRHDAPASVRQAYTPEEMQTLLAQTSAARVEIHRHYLFRMGVIAWKHVTWSRSSKAMKCHPERSEGPMHLIAFRLSMSNAQVLRFAQDDKYCGDLLRAES